jgi:hypothetical protein
MNRDETQIARLRTLAEEMREQMREASDLEERLKSVNGRIHTIQFSEMVDTMNVLGVATFGIAKQGNSPALEFELDTYYAGSISKEWEEPRREAAFAVLPDELVKITVSALFAKGEADDARALAEELITTGYTVTIEKSIHHSTLKAWLREQAESGGDLPDLETIGATIGPRVKVKEIKE